MNLNGRNKETGGQSHQNEGNMSGRKNDIKSEIGGGRKKETRLIDRKKYEGRKKDIGGKEGNKQKERLKQGEIANGRDQKGYRMERKKEMEKIKQ